MDIRNLVLKIVIDALLNLAGKRIRKIERIEGCIRRFLQITNLLCSEKPGPLGQDIYYREKYHGNYEVVAWQGCY